MASIIEKALTDLQGIGYGCGTRHKYSAMEFILSETCEVYCLELKIDYETIKEKAVKLYNIAAVDNTTEKKAVNKRHARIHTKPKLIIKPKLSAYRGKSRRALLGALGEKPRKI